MAITKTGNALTTAGKFLLKDHGYLTGALGIGAGTMSVAGGMNSAGGEVAGGVSGLAAGNLAKGALSAIGVKGKLGALGGMVGGFLGYDYGSNLANKYTPIYKRGSKVPTPQVINSQQLNIAPKVNNNSSNFQRSQSPSYAE